MNLIFLLAAVPLAAQVVVRAPSLGVSVLGAASAPLAAPRLAAPTLSMTGLSLPAARLPTLALPLLPTAAAARPIPLASAQPLAAAVEAVQKTQDSASAAAPILQNLFDGRVSPRPLDAVPGWAPDISPRLTLGAPLVNAVTPADEPPAPKQPAWKRAATVIGRILALPFGLWGGLRVGDLAYGLALSGTGIAGLVLTSALLAGGAWFLSRKERTLGSRLLWGGLLASSAFSVVGQLAWDVTGSALFGLAGGLLLGTALAAFVILRSPRRA